MSSFMAINMKRKLCPLITSDSGESFRREHILQCDIDGFKTTSIKCYFPLCKALDVSVSQQNAQQEIVSIFYQSDGRTY